MVQVLLLFAGLSTCDPGNILDSIKVAKQQRVRASVIGLAAEVRICRVITDVRSSDVPLAKYLHCLLPMPCTSTYTRPKRPLHDAQRLPLLLLMNLLQCFLSPGLVTQPPVLTFLYVANFTSSQTQAVLLEQWQKF